MPVVNSIANKLNDVKMTMKYKRFVKLVNKMERPVQYSFLKRFYNDMMQDFIKADSEFVPKQADNSIAYGIAVQRFNCGYEGHIAFIKDQITKGLEKEDNVIFCKIVRNRDIETNSLSGIFTQTIADDIDEGNSDDLYICITVARCNNPDLASIVANCFAMKNLLSVNTVQNFKTINARFAVEIVNKFKDEDEKSMIERLLKTAF